MIKGLESDIMNKQTPFSIHGVVIAAAWTPQGDIKEIDIAGYDEKRYRVVEDHIGGKLRNYIKKSVVVEGFVKSRDGGLVITVKRFHIDEPGVSKSNTCKTAPLPR
jgi:hypothetical protein